jgi:tetratricopeptide (TPR) repeat protein
VVGGLGLLVLPLLVSLANAARVRNCNLTAGLAFFALLPVATALYASVSGALAGLLLPRRGRLLAWLLPVGSIVWALLRLYVDPPVYAFDPYAGYFPGPIYDEALQPPLRLLGFRLVNLLWLTTAVVVFLAGRALRAGREARRPLRLAAWLAPALALLAGSVAAFAARGPLGFHVTKARLAQVLSRETRTPHFVLRTDPSSGETEADLQLVARDLEFRYQQLHRTLGAAPAGPITVYQFPSAAAKKDLVGAAHTLYAKPWTREIFVQTDRFPAGRLRHELAHVFAGAFGDPVFGISLAWRLPFPRLASGLVEGIAEAADYGDPDGRSTVHQQARAIVADGRAPPLPQVVGAGFTTLSGPRAYTLAGSFTHFLLHTRGAEALRAVYRSGGDFLGVYGQRLEALETEWRAFLEKQPEDARERARARERFRRGAIFQKVCARELAARVQGARARLPTDPRGAVALLESVCRDDPAEPTFRLELAEALAAAGVTGAALEAAAAIERDEEQTFPLRARAAGLAASVHYHGGRLDEARAAIERAIGFATDDGELRTLEVKRRALASAEATRTIGRVMFGDSLTRSVEAGLVVHLVEAFTRATPDEALGPYLLARQLAWRDPALALPWIAQACPAAAPGRAVPLPPVFLKECRRMAGETAFRAGDLAAAEAAYRALEDAAETEAERLRARDFLERIEWERARPAQAAR